MSRLIPTGVNTFQRPLLTFHCVSCLLLEVLLADVTTLVALPARARVLGRPLDRLLDPATRDRVLDRALDQLGLDPRALGLVVDAPDSALGLALVLAPHFLALVGAVTPLSSLAEHLRHPFLFGSDPHSIHARFTLGSRALLLWNPSTVARRVPGGKVFPPFRPLCSSHFTL